MHNINTTIILDDDSPLLKGNFSTSEGTIECLNYQDYYMIKSGKALNSLGRSIKQAKLSLSLLNSTSLNVVASNDEEKAELIQLWVENSIIRVQSIYDRSLILVNRIFDLGLANESMSHNTIVCNEHVKRFGVDTLMKAINKKCNDYRNIRNTVIHHDRYTEEALSNLILILETNHLSLEVGKGEFIQKSEIDAMVQEYLSTKKEELTAYLDEIETKVEALYDTLIPIYKRKKSELSR